MTYFVKKLGWLAQLAVALSCGLLVFIGIQTAGDNAGVGQGIYILLFDVFGVPQTMIEADFLLGTAGVLLGISAMIPGMLVVANMYIFLNRHGFRFGLQSIFVAMTWVCLLLATVVMFRNSEIAWSGLPKAWVFMAIYLVLVWYLIHSFLGRRRKRGVAPPENSIRGVNSKNRTEK